MLSATEQLIDKSADTMVHMHIMFQNRVIQEGEGGDTSFIFLINRCFKIFLTSTIITSSRGLSWKATLFS